MAHHYSLRKRPLAPSDANCPSPKAIKTTADGQENETANAWYDTLNVKHLTQLCEDRGIKRLGSSTNNYRLKDADRKGNIVVEDLNAEEINQRAREIKPKLEERKGQRLIYLNDREEEVLDRLNQETGATQGRQAQLNDMRVPRIVWAEDHLRDAVEHGNFPIVYTSADDMTEMCKLRGVSAKGTKDQLKGRLMLLDEEMMKKNKPYIDRQKADALRHSPAGRRALEIMTGLERKEYGGKDPVPRDESKGCEERSLNVAEEEVSIIAQQLLDEDKVPEAGVIGARLMWSKIPTWLQAGMTSGYTSLHAEELKEILSLRGQDTRGLKPELIGKLEALDIAYCHDHNLEIKGHFSE
ncbi:hypothetical protein NA57DRAFT_71990 [Rhizodiscina lignyota]|uniref:SAP domain-containing protein n=1 Tax=Rhizodiscina lignyota TaxID=1504668 RepID=A0A9P4IR61_9PEZI|nr:hypothetical protein NA57DRAFT_71990 [Rhizodiscina lignyota]